MAGGRRAAAGLAMSRRRNNLFDAHLLARELARRAVWRKSTWRARFITPVLLAQHLLIVWYS